MRPAAGGRARSPFSTYSRRERPAIGGLEVIERIRHGDVLQLRMSGWTSRLIGYSASAYLARGAMVDVGFPRVARALRRVLEESPIEGAFITHHHEDHAGNVELLAARGIPIAAAPTTLELLRAVDAIAFYRWVTWGTPAPLRSAVVPFAHESLRLIHAPGHCPDHHVVWDGERGDLFAGDLFLGVKVRIAHPGEDPRQLARSVRAAAALQPSRLFCAHRGLVEQPVRQLLAKAAWLEETIGAIEARLMAGQTETQIRSELLGAETLSGRLSFGDYSKGNFVRAVRRSMAPG